MGAGVDRGREVEVCKPIERRLGHSLCCAINGRVSEVGCLQRSVVQVPRVQNGT
jgi:hypothetical protein